MGQPRDKNDVNRRDFLRTGLGASVAAATVGAARVEANTAATPESRAGRPTFIRVTNAKPGAPLRKPWKNAIDVDVPVTLLRADVQSYLAKLQRDIGYRYCRAYGFFQDEMATVTRRKDGSLAFRWAQSDKVLDALLQIGLRPFVNLSPMPVALASGTTTIFDWKVNCTPPRDYGEWGQLVGALGRHCVDRYGLDEVAQWYFEVWNEPNINFWTGTQADYWKLYDVSAKTLKAVSPRLRVGGPVTARSQWIPEMISHCSTAGVPLDFISTHIYPFDIYELYPDLKGCPYKPSTFVVDVVRRVRQTIHQSAMPHLELHYTEWHSWVPVSLRELFRHGNPDLHGLPSAANACYLATVLDGDCDTFAWWEATDIDGQNGLPQSEFSRTPGLLTLSGLPKATFNAFRFLNRLRGGRLELQHQALPPGCGLVATTEGETRYILLWHRIMPEVEKQQPWLGVLELPWTERAKPLLLEERIAAGAGSCYATWQALGTPQNLSPTERDLLKVHSAPEARLFHPQAQGGRVRQEFRLAPGEVLYCELRPQGAVALPKAPLRQELAAWYAARRGAKRDTGTE